MHVAAVGLQVDDRISDNLARTVVGDIAATSCFADGDVACGQFVRRGKNMGAPAIAARTKRQHVRMFEEQQHVAHEAPLPFVHERALQRERVVIRHKAKPPDFDESRH
jgi:hypothetical protein